MPAVLVGRAHHRPDAHLETCCRAAARRSCFGVVLFYFLLHVDGLSIDDARNMGLLLPHVPIAFEPDSRVASAGTRSAAATSTGAAIAAHLPETLVVTSASAITILMNSTAIGAATGEDIDLNREMRVAGLANIASGMLGGMVGYQSFNRSMLNCARGRDKPDRGRVRRPRVPAFAGGLAGSGRAISGAGAGRASAVHGTAPVDPVAGRRIRQARLERVSARSASFSASSRSMASSLAWWRASSPRA